MRSRASLVARDGRRGVPVPLVRVGPARGDERVVGAASGRREGNPRGRPAPLGRRVDDGAEDPPPARAPRDGIRVRVHALGRGERPEARRIRIRIRRHSRTSSRRGRGGGGDAGRGPRGLFRRTTRAIERRAADDRGEGGGGGVGGEGGEGVGVEGPGEGDGVGSDRGGFRDDRPESSNDAAGEDAAAEGGARGDDDETRRPLGRGRPLGGLSGLSLGGGPTTPTPLRRIRRREKTRGAAAKTGKARARRRNTRRRGASVEPSADPERSGRSGRISAKARRDLKKARRRRTETGATDERPEEDGPEEGPEDGPEDEDRSDEDRSSSSGRDDFGGRAKSNSKTGAHQTPPGPGPQGPGPQKKKKLSRGKAAKAKRAAARYADQDDEDRELAAGPRRRRGREKGKGFREARREGEEGERGKNTAAAVWGEEDPAADREGGILARRQTKAAPRRSRTVPTKPLRLPFREDDPTTPRDAQREDQQRPARRRVLTHPRSSRTRRRSRRKTPTDVARGRSLARRGRRRRDRELPSWRRGRRSAGSGTRRSSRPGIRRRARRRSRRRRFARRRPSTLKRCGGAASRVGDGGGGCGSKRPTSSPTAKRGSLSTRATEREGVQGAR